MIHQNIFNDVDMRMLFDGLNSLFGQSKFFYVMFDNFIKG